MRGRTVWVLTDGRAGNEAQALGLAEALGRLVPLTLVSRRIEVVRPWRWLPPWLIVAPLAGVHPPLAPPWPDLVVSCGRQSVAPAAAIRRQGGGTVRAVALLDPHAPPAWFDLVVVPEHDRLRGANVLTCAGSLNRVTPERLAAAGALLADRIAHLPRPRVALLVGGNARAYRLTPERAAAIGREVAAAVTAAGGSLLATPSRRTPPAAAAALRAAVAGVPQYFWNGAGENPYFGLLALAEALLVTEDSVNMVSEALATGRPVMTLALEGGSAKFRRFHASLAARGLARPFAGRIESRAAPPLAETQRIAGLVADRLGLRGADQL